MTFRHCSNPNVINVRVSIQHSVPTYDYRKNKIQKLLHNHQFEYIGVPTTRLYTF